MTTFILHPAISRLLRYQAQANARRLLRSFSTPRRLVLSLLGLLLASVWLGNVIVSMLLREPTDPSRFHSLVSGGLFVYALWHLLKVACRRPEDAFEWTAAEQEQLCGRPFKRRELIGYRFASIAIAGAFKASCFGILMLPDLRVWPAGIFGAFLGLLFLDFVRMSVETVACGVSSGTFQRLRLGVLAITACAGISALIIAFSSSVDHTSSTFGLLIGFLEAASQLRTTWIAVLMELPFRVFVNVIAAPAVSGALGGWLLIAVALVLVAAYFVPRLDAHFMKARGIAERQAYDRLKHDNRASKAEAETDIRLPRVPWYAGMGPLAWRQLQGVLDYRTSLFIALAAPAVLSVVPLLVHRNSGTAILHVVGSLAFFSLLLLPAAVKFDFRRDVDRLGVLKSLPIGPLKTVAGQLLTPLLVALLFQSAVLVVALVVHPNRPGTLGMSLVLLLPLNLVIFGLENLFFLLYPYRLRQEGLEVFLRTTLVFTGKALLFTLALGIMLGWAYAAPWISARVLGTEAHVPLLFAMGLFGMLCVSALATTYSVVWAYERFDPSQDVPA